MIEKVRSIAIALFLLQENRRNFSAYNGGIGAQQGSAMARLHTPPSKARSVSGFAAIARHRIVAATASRQAARPTPSH
jgi:hypothetical protein